MKLFLKVKPNAKIERVKEIDPAHFEIWIRESPQEGRANQAVIRVLASHLRIPASHLKIISGAKSKQKVIQIL